MNWLERNKVSILAFIIGLAIGGILSGLAGR